MSRRAGSPGSASTAAHSSSIERVALSPERKAEVLKKKAWTFFETKRPDEALAPYLDAAERCVRRYGWSRTSPKDIAREADARHAASVQGDHWYCWLLAVHPDHQGEGRKAETRREVDLVVAAGLNRTRQDVFGRIGATLESKQVIRVEPGAAHRRLGDHYRACRPLPLGWLWRLPGGHQTDSQLALRTIPWKPPRSA